ncbi:MAG: thioredoxin family protein [Anaerolineae bacterium]|nr:thioredoxin family protein [Caldilineales bacterium]MCX7853375.1 thioredoxin family protein [Caldilineales bacterium]MDW8268539.1 thioredoxin family protein [Anaerolineae bacterium]
MKIQILGTGCHNCLELQLRLGEAITASGRSDVEVEYVDDEHQIRHYIPLDAVPGLVIDGHLVSEREVPSLERLVSWLRTGTT